MSAFLTRSCSDTDSFSYLGTYTSNPEEDALNDRKKGTEDYDRLYRLHLAVDERMVATKAKIGLKQYIKNNPTKWGIKLFVLADSNGYTMDFQIYDGKAKNIKGRGLSFDAVVSLKKKDFLGSS